MITVEGIDSALSGLGYLGGSTLKSRLLVLLRDFYDNNNETPTVEKIDRDELIRSLWGLGNDPKAVKNKRKNFSSLKSSVNKDLRNLYQNEQNPEGIIIGPHNVFALSNEAKDRILENLSATIRKSGTANLDKITEVMGVVNELLSNSNALLHAQGTRTKDKLDQLRNVLNSLSSSVESAFQNGSLSEERSDSGFLAEELGGAQPDPSGPLESLGDEKSDEPEEIEENEVLEEIEEDQIDPEDVTEELELLDEENMLLEDEGYTDIESADMQGKMENSVEAGGLDEESEVIERLEEEPEALEETEDLAETEVAESFEEIEESDELQEEARGEAVAGEAANGAKGSEALGLPVNSLGQSFLEGEFESGKQIDESRLLAEEFDGYLGAMDRFFNHYLLIPAGKFVLGSRTPGADGLIERIVGLDTFYIGRFPVTNALFEIFVEKTGYKTTAEKQGYGTVYKGRYGAIKDSGTGKKSLCWQSAVTCKRVEGACWFQPSGPGSTLHNKRNHPVVQVSLEDAIAFAAWTGKRLPTEEEWEAATRTGRGNTYPWGNEWEEDQCNLEESREGSTTPVDRFVLHANELGVVDALGNVLEWTIDARPSYSDEKNGIRFCVARGGNWTSSRNSCSLLSRFMFEPAFHSNILGFRCVAS
jgi:formylglycine-generating enzyme required for sulfatase activity